VPGPGAWGSRRQQGHGPPRPGGGASLRGTLQRACLAGGWGWGGSAVETGVTAGVAGAVLFGLVFGSFLGAVTWRVPRGISILWPPSRCPTCGRALGPAELVPVVSFLVQRGRCRGCGSAIGWRYVAVEAATAVLWGAVAWHATHWADAAFGWAVASLAVAATATDLEHRRIPNGLVAAAAAVWLALWLAGRPFPLARAAAGALVFGGPLLLLALWRPAAMGFGDVKLAGVFGLYLGWPDAAAAFFVAVLSGAAVAAALLVAGRKSRGDAIPFGPFLAGGAVAAFLWGDALVRWYVASW
jgi:leader peptidase (prepilin peptidase)/N-methyltransferase